MELHDPQLDRWVAEALLVDRYRLGRRLAQIRRAATRGIDMSASLEEWREDCQASSARRQWRASPRPPVVYDDALPIAARREEIAAAIREHQVIVVCGETGSGKSTQIPKICLDLGLGVDGLIGHTQPRRIAARSIAARIADELGGQRAAEVAYKIRFADTTRPETRVKLMTDGVLLAESLHDRWLEQYDTIILDEAHERSLNIDLLLGLLARLLPRRRDLKVIVMSATIDAERFAEYFARHVGAERRMRRDSEARLGGTDSDLGGDWGSDEASERAPVPVIQVAGRTFPVEVRYRPPRLEEGEVDADTPRSIAAALEELNGLERGDVLVFLPTERDIHETMRVLKGHPAANDGDTELLPLYARLSTREQQRIFNPHAKRRIVLATNVAESSLTVPGIRYVIDTGLARVHRYAPRGKVQRLPIEPISQASADQRAGRCGRVAPGVCLRLFSEQDYLERERFATPEIRRTTLAAPILQTKALRLGALESLPLMDPPHSDMVRDGYQTLFELGALDDRRELTPLGRTLARLPVDPRIGRMILAAREENCLAEILVIAAALEVQDPRERPADRQEAADHAHARFRDGRSDFLALLNVWERYQTLKRESSRSKLRRACQREFLSYSRLREWADIHRQLLTLVRHDLAAASRASGPPSGMPAKQAVSRAESSRPEQPAHVEPTPTEGSDNDSMSSDAESTWESSASSVDRAKFAAIHRSILTGLLSGIAYRSDGHEYTAAGQVKVSIWPGAGPFSRKPPWIVAAEIVETNRRYARLVASVDPRWIEQLAGPLVRRTYSEPEWRRAAGTVLVTERTTLFGLPLSKRRVPYGPIDPVSTREIFIREALVGGEADINAAFFRENLRLRDELARHAAKARRPDLFVDSRACLDFYHERLPAEVYDVPTLHRWRRTAERGQPRLLWMRREDLVDAAAPPVDESGFPDELMVNELRLPLKYRFEPGMNDDGVTLVVPLEALGQVTAARVDWVVPALLREKVERLVRSLPKSLRRELPPAEVATDRVLASLRYGEGAFLSSVADALSEMTGHTTITPDQFQLEKLPHYLRFYIRVVGARGETLAVGRDVDQIWAKLGIQPQPFREIPDAQWTRSGMTRWDWKELPREISVRRAGVDLPAFPTVIDRGQSVDLRLLDSRDESRRRTRRGVRRLFMLATKAALEEQVEWLPNLPAWSTSLVTRLKPERLRAQLVDLLADRMFLGERPLPRSAVEFRERLDAGRKSLENAVFEVVRVLDPLAREYEETRRLLAQFPPPHLPDAVRDVLRQLDRLFVRDFLTETPWYWLEQFARYFRGAQERLRRVGQNAARDRELQGELERLWRDYETRWQRNRSLGRFDDELETHRWWLEEYRMSLFAQTVGTAFPISRTRLDRHWDSIVAPGRPNA
ncbi:MAG: ATP-dependent RNA helicase HrpA [Pirellulales bacterium]